MTTPYKIKFHFKSYKELVNESLMFGICPPCVWGDYIPLKISYKCHGVDRTSTWLEPDTDMIYNCDKCGKLLHFTPPFKEKLQEITTEWLKT